jgi:hypothetical protein
VVGKLKYCSNKIANFCKKKFEYILLFIVSVCLVLAIDLHLIKYFKDKEVQDINSNMQFITKTINGLLLKDLQSAYYVDGQTEHLFCITDNNIDNPGVKKIPIKNKIIACNTRLIKERLDNIIPKYINYKIDVDKITLLSSGNKSLKPIAELTSVILKDIELTTQVSLDIYSDYFKNSKKESNKNMYFLLLSSGIIWLLVISSMFYLIFKFNKSLVHNKKLELELKKLDVIRLADNKAKSFTNKFYKYSKTLYNFSNFNTKAGSKIEELYDAEDYMPIPLLDMSLVNSRQMFKVDLEETINELEPMIDSYKSLNSYNIIFTSDISLKHIMMPFNQLLFDQIMISLIANIIYFAKDKKNNRHISLVINDESITLIHDAFNLNKEMMIEYCQRLFYETKNPFIITFGQIFIILNSIYNLKFDVYNENNENVIKLYLPKENFTKEENILTFKRNGND